MKEVVTEKQSPTVSCQEVDPHKFYGVEYWNSKGFITRPYYKNGDYQAKSLGALTMGNFFAAHTDPNLKRFVENLIKAPNVKVFEFETTKELMSWLAE